MNEIHGGYTFSQLHPSLRVLVRLYLSEIFILHFPNKLLKVNFLCWIGHHQGFLPWLAHNIQHYNVASSFFQYGLLLGFP
jgi:hypothetical protein